MKAHQHAMIGAAIGSLASLLPDVALATYRWKGELHPQHPLPVMHRFLHSWQGLWFTIVLSYAAHLVCDWYSHQPHLFLPSPDIEDYLEYEAIYRTEQKRRTAD